MDFAESYNHDIFRVYVPKKVKIGLMHPDPVVETSFFLFLSSSRAALSRLWSRPTCTTISISRSA